MLPEDFPPQTYGAQEVTFSNTFLRKLSVETHTLTHTRRNWNQYACHLSNVLIQHDKTSVIYKVIERKVFWSTSPSIMSRQQAVKHITVRSGLLFTARLRSALWSAGIMWLLFKVCSIKNTFYLQDNRCRLGRECALMKSWFVNASCLDWGPLVVSPINSKWLVLYQLIKNITWSRLNLLSVLRKLL